MNVWLIEQTTWDQLEAARASGATLDADRVEAFAAEVQAAEQTTPRALSVSAGTAEISVRGVLTKTPDLFARLFGGGNTTYAEIQSAIRAAENDPSVERIVFAIDSPGGTVDGLFDTVAAIRAANKPTMARASRAASAAYALAAAAGKIEAVGRDSSFGSIGIVSSQLIRSNVVDVTSTAAPKKRPDASTEEGKAVIREYLDQVHALFAEAIAEGRGVSAQTVNDTYGQGATLLASAALDRGMIDSIAGPDLRVVGANQAAAAAQETETKIMKWTEFKAQHPEEAAKAIEEGVGQERERVLAHLKMGEACGDMAIAVGAIREAKGFGPEISAEYMAANMNRKDRQARADDEQTVAAATAGAATETKTRDLGDELADAMGAPQLEA